MLTDTDLQQLKNKSISTDTLEYQLSCFKNGFPYADLQKAATIGDGIIGLSNDEIPQLINDFEEVCSKGLDASKFVPASGAATRMFKDLFNFIQSSPKDQQALVKKEPYKTFVDKLKLFAFVKELKKYLPSETTEKSKIAKEAITYLLTEEGLNYGSLPKGLLKFHKNGRANVTPFEEHLRETAKYCKSTKGEGKVHFTVSPEHQEKFKKLLKRVKSKYEELYLLKYDISFSFQKPSTDTVAANPDNTPFRNDDGSLLFRPGGHGALIENLNDIDSDLVFIKNIDNVVPEHLQQDTVTYKKVLGGLLLKKKEVVFSILEGLDSKDKNLISKAIELGILFMKSDLQLDVSESFMKDTIQNKVEYLKNRLNRPIRVCGMVKNEGEPGGGPFWVKQSDGTVSLQIVEGAQIDPKAVAQQKILQSSTHFNPVDLACYIKDYKGDKFNLHQYIDPSTGFISEKTQNGKPLKALELPGLWNGAMANWLTFFVEVPISTFNPVKTVMDLLRPQHQPQKRKDKV